MDGTSLRGAVRERLAFAGCVAAEEEADELVSAAPDHVVLDAWVRRREAGEPLAWLTGWVTFCGRRLRVDRGVFVPRPQSEELARRAAAAVPGAGRVVDLCTGAGAIARTIAATAPGAVIVATDADARAARCARENGVRTLVTDLDAGLVPHAFDVVTAVAPYVPTEAMRLLPSDVQRYEPRIALDGGAGGLHVLRRVVVAAARLLVAGGALLVELGARQGDALLPVLEAQGFDEPVCWYDEEGDLRGLSTRLTE